MTAKRILILGGYGSTGLPLARLLLSNTDVSIVLAGRSLEKARRAAATLNAACGANRARGVFADAGDPQSLRKAFEGIDLVAVASSTSEFAETVARSAIQAGIDYLDVQYSAAKMRLLRSMAAEIERSGRCFISECGFHPGLPAAMVRYAASEFDRLDSANIGSVIKIDWKSLNPSPATIREFIGEFMNFQTLHFKDGRWQKAGAMAMMIPRFMDFGGQFGQQYCIPMFLEEMYPLPEAYPSLRDTGFFVGGFNWFVDWFLSPLIMLGLKLFPKQAIGPLGRVMMWGLKIFSPPPYGTILKLEARGVQNNAPKFIDLLISHPDAYMLTAIPVAACLMQYLDGNIRKPGLWLQAHMVEPKRFFRDMQTMGAAVTTSASETA
ncbi:MAG: saccharopine dehydrogenase NADP-binding domain-containing protein [Bryobacterales bacterium]|nr:saccharopine dehydrogenase NADP-binding domain-containing protein [Bryobacterales bacterium]